MKRWRWIPAMVGALAVGAACSDDSPSGEAVTGRLVLQLTTPHGDDGALLFELSGPPIDSAVAVNASLRLFTRGGGGTTLVGALVGAVAAGSVVTLHVPDEAAAGLYTARILQVADREDQLRTSLDGYALTVTP